MPEFDCPLESSIGDMKTVFVLIILLFIHLSVTFGFRITTTTRSWMKMNRKTAYSLKLGQTSISNDNQVHMNTPDPISASITELTSYSEQISTLSPQISSSTAAAAAPLSKQFIRDMKHHLMKYKPIISYHQSFLGNIISFYHSVPAEEFTMTLTKLITVIVSSRKPLNLEKLLLDIEQFHKLDYILYTTAINSLRYYNRPNDAYEIFNRVLRQENGLVDIALFCSGLDAACQILEWDAYRELVINATTRFSSTNMTKIFNDAIANYKYSDKYPNSILANKPPSELVLRSFQLVLLMQSMGYAPTSQTMTSVLSVVCAHGSIDDVTRVMTLIDQLHLNKTTTALNILLNRFVEDNDATNAMNTFQELNSNPAYTPDIVTYGTMMKFCLRNHDLKAAEQIAQLIVDKNITASPRMNVLLIQLYDQQNDVDSVVSLMESTPVHMMSGYMFSNAITALAHHDESSHTKIVLRWLSRAEMLRKADEAVYTATVQALVRYREYSKASAILNRMRDNNLPWNRYSVSVAITNHLAWIKATHDDMRAEVIQRLHGILQNIISYDASLLSDSSNFKILSRLCDVGEPLAACQLQLGPLSHTICSRMVLSQILDDMQELCERGASSISNAMRYARSSLALLGLCRTQESSRQRRILRTSHFNAIFRMLATSMMIEEAEKLFQYMSSASWKPSTFTIAELIRISRIARSPQLAHDIILWATKHPNTYVPLAVMNEAVSYVYSHGRTELASTMYNSLYATSKITHWQGNELTMDLHNYSRGLAYAAMVCALEEVKHKLRDDAREEISLLVITGQSLAQEAPAGPGSYLLLSELQNILIEDIYPPLSSSTIPGNPGRLLIHVPNPNRSAQQSIV